MSDSEAFDAIDSNKRFIKVCQMRRCGSAYVDFNIGHLGRTTEAVVLEACRLALK